MPTYDKRARYPNTPNRISIPTLSGGVGRQAPPKRTINEAQNLDNILVTLERSVEKRAGTNFIRRYSNSAMTTIDSVLDGSTPTSDPRNFGALNLNDRTVAADYKFFWFQVAEDQRYLIAINFKDAASVGSPTSDEKSKYMQIFKVTKTGFIACNLSGHNTDEMFNYFTYKAGDTTLTADDSLSSITLGPQILFNNSNVKSGYSSKLKTFTAEENTAGVRLETEEDAAGTGDIGDGGRHGTLVTENQTAWCTVGLDGEFHTYISDAAGGGNKTHYVEDTKGRKLVYFTTTPVDTEGQATLYVDGKFYVKNDQVFVSVPAGTDLSPYLLSNVGGSGNLSFSSTVTGGASDTDMVSQSDIPNDLRPLDLIRIESDKTDAGNGGKKSLKFFFSSANGRTAFKALDYFTVDGKTVPVASGANSVVGDEYIATYLEDLGVMGDIVDSIEGESSYPFNKAYTFGGNVNLGATSIPSSISGSDFIDSDNVTKSTMGDSLTLVFTCLRDGTANSSTIPSNGTVSASSEAYFGLRSEDDGGPLAKYIPVKDWQYPDSTRRYLGNQLADFSQFNFPPRSGENTLESDGSPQYYPPDSTTKEVYTTFNQPPTLMEDKIKSTMQSLYTDIDASGHGKIYYVENSYAGEVPGYYLVKNITETPYTRLVRTPEEYSVLDEDRFPKIIKISGFDSNNIENFVVQNMDLEERRSGNLTTNTGPEAFKDGEQKAIKSMAFFRDRLFLSAGDTVFSSRTGDFSDFWVENPGVIADTDPIDVRLSTNKYAEVESMTPFASSLFINTGSDIQFTLKGSENNITPFTAEVSPTAFYSTSPLVNPVLLGSQIYFFAPKRAYVYFSDTTVTVNQAIEVSLNCPNYLPTTFGDIAVVPGYDSMCMIDKDNRKFLYVYTNRYRGAEVVQNAFFRYIYDEDLMSVTSYDNDIYFVSRQESITEPTNKYKYFVAYQSFYENNNAVPRLDHMITFDESLTDGSGDHATGSITYAGGNTTLKVKFYGNSNPDTMYIATGDARESRAGEVYELSEYSPTISNGVLTVVIPEDLRTTGKFRKFIFGTSYSSTIELSPQYIRDEGNNVVEGVLSLRTLHLQHHNTGTYRIEKETRGRRSEAMVFSPSELDATTVCGVVDPDDAPLPFYEKQGETFTKIMGYAAETGIFIVSDYPNPMNIAQIELKGRFTNRTSGFVR